MKVGIITFHASHNYGSMLQAYALTKCLVDMGCAVEIVNLRTEKQHKMYPHPMDFKTRSLKGVIRDFVYNPILATESVGKWYKYERFLKRLPLTREYKSYDELRSERWDYDVLIVGSDQIWNTACRDWDESFFGTFVPDSMRKIAYAPSMGPSPESSVDKELVRRLCKGFYKISVRESQAKNLLDSIGIIDDISIALDPTLLLNGSDYDDICPQKPLVKGEYLFFYDPFRRPKYLRLACIIGELVGLPIVCDRYYYRADIKGLQKIKFCVNTGPVEFLNLVKNAKLVCGHSFHSVVFSILFRKDFYALNGDSDSRMMNLLSLLHLEERAVSLEGPMNLANTTITTYDEVFKELESARAMSRDFLCKCGF